MSLHGKIALVTGASRGIGKAIAQMLAENGAKVIGTATTEQGTERIVEHLQAHGYGLGVTLNVTQTKSIENAFATIINKVGHPSILINNAGVTSDKLLLRMQEADWFSILNANLTGVFRLIKTCLRPMVKARWGRIVNISSIVAFMGNSGQTNYAAAKAGLIGFSKSLAREVASRGITVNLVAPGFILTDMTRDLTEEQHLSLISKIPVGRIGNTMDIAHAVNFLVSEAAGYITGETIHVNGGMLMD